LKNQDKHPIDNYFKDYMEQDFPYKPSSWKKATVVIDNYFGKRRKLAVIVALFLVTSGIALFLAFDTKNKTARSIATSPSTKESETKNHSFTEVEANNENSTLTIVEEQSNNSQDKFTSKSNGTPKQIENEIPRIAESIQDISNSENKNELTISMPTESSDSSPAKEKSTFFTDFVLYSKPLVSFNFNITNNAPQAAVGEEMKKKKYAFMIEFENLFSTSTKQKLSGLSKAEIGYKDKYESIKNTNSYHLNLLFQRGKFGFITGLGYQNAIIKTDYLATHVSYDTKILYKTENKTATASSGSYLIITTRVDTLGKRTEVSKIENQQDQAFEWLLVPLKISYQYPHKRFRFSIRTGVDLSWLYNSNGSFINSDLKSVSSIDDNQLKRFNANMSAQFMTGYQLNKRFQVGGSTYYSNQLGSNFKNYTSRFQNTGLGLYVRIGF
jgi:hypothetical protein